MENDWKSLTCSKLRSELKSRGLDTRKESGACETITRE